MERLLSIKDLKTRDGKEKSWRYAEIQKGAHPRPIKIGGSSRWLESEYEIFIAAQIAASRGEVEAA